MGLLKIGGDLLDGGATHVAIDYPTKDVRKALPQAPRGLVNQLLRRLDKHDPLSTTDDLSAFVYDRKRFSGSSRSIQYEDIA
jgi:hypothetical protein